MKPTLDAKGCFPGCAESGCEATRCASARAQREYMAYLEETKPVTHPVLTNPETEPEAAHLRGVLRKIQDQTDDFFDPEAVHSIRSLIARALARKPTNGTVIDALQARVAELEGQIENANLADRPAPTQDTTKVANDAMLCAFSLCILSVETFVDVYPASVPPEGEMAYARHVLERLLNLLHKLREQYTVEDA